MSLNIDKMIRPVNCDGSPILVMNSWTLLTSYNVVSPGKIFHSNSIGSPSIVSKVLYCDEFLNHVQSKINVSMQNHASQLYSLHRSHLIVRLSTFQICRTSVHCENVPVFLMECKFSKYSFPMNTDACNVEDTNIHHVKECLLLSCVASFEEWS